MHGTGKTFMAAAIANEIMGGGTAVLYISAPALFVQFTEYRMRYLRDDTYSDALYRLILSCRLLIIDDLGTEFVTESRFSEFMLLLNERIAPGRRSTIISTNMSLSELRSNYEDRIFSRILGSFRVIRFYGEDIRLLTSVGRGKRDR
jgi:DNA replication protein DnaC